MIHPYGSTGSFFTAFIVQPGSKGHKQQVVQQAWWAVAGGGAVQAEQGAVQAVAGSEAVQAVSGGGAVKGVAGGDEGGQCRQQQGGGSTGSSKGGQHRQSQPPVARGGRVQTGESVGGGASLVHCKHAGRGGEGRVRQCMPHLPLVLPRADPPSNGSATGPQRHAAWAAWGAQASPGGAGGGGEGVA